MALSDVYELGGTFIERRCPESADDCVREAELEILDVQIRRDADSARSSIASGCRSPPPTWIGRSIDETVRQYPNIADRAALRAQVEASGQRWDQYREELFEYLRDQNFQGRVLAPRVTMNDNEVQDRYQRETRRMKKDVAMVTGFGIALPEGTDPVPEAPPEGSDPADPPSERDQVRAQANLLVNALNAGEIPWDEAVVKFDGAGGGQHVRPGVRRG